MPAQLSAHGVRRPCTPPAAFDHLVLLAILVNCVFMALNDKELEQLMQETGSGSPRQLPQ